MDKRKEITLIFIIGLALSVAVIKIVYLIFFQADKYISFQSLSGNGNHHRTARYSIVDVNHLPLAISQEKYNVYVNTQKSTEAQQGLSDIAKILNLKEDNFKNAIDKKKIVLVKRFIDKKDAEAIYKLNNTSILLEKLYQRVYPQGRVLSQTLGFMSYSGKGLTGLEKRFDDFLKIKKIEERHQSVKLVLTIDAELQSQVEAKLNQTLAQSDAQSATVIVQELSTGKIRTLANVPNFDPNYFTKTDPKLFKNIAISKPIEPGSIFKAFFIAYLLDKFPNLNPADKSYHSDGFYLLKNGERIKDSIAYGDISLQDIIKYSINSGVIQATEKFSQLEMKNYLERFHYQKNFKNRYTR